MKEEGVGTKTYTVDDLKQTLREQEESLKEASKSRKVKGRFRMAIGGSERGWISMIKSDISAERKPAFH